MNLRQLRTLVAIAGNPVIARLDRAISRRDREMPRPSRGMTAATP